MLKKDSFIIITFLTCIILYGIISFLVFVTNGKIYSLVKKKITIGTTLITLTAILSSLLFNSTPTSAAVKNSATPESTPTLIACYVPTPPSTTPPQKYQADVDYTIIGDWSSGATINILITNKDSQPITNWNLSFTFKENQEILNLWNGTFTQSGQSVVIKCTDWNSEILPGESVSLGFNIDYTNSNTIPNNIQLN